MQVREQHQRETTVVGGRPEYNFRTLLPQLLPRFREAQVKTYLARDAPEIELENLGFTAGSHASFSLCEIVGCRYGMKLVIYARNLPVSVNYHRRIEELAAEGPEKIL